MELKLGIERQKIIILSFNMFSQRRTFQIAAVVTLGPDRSEIKCREFVL